MSKLTREQGPYADGCNAVLQSPSLSLADKGLYMYLRSKPHDWAFAAERIADECGSNRRAIQEGLVRLEDAGLLERQKRQDGSVDYRVGFSFPEHHQTTRGANVTNPHSAKSAHIYKQDTKQNKREHKNKAEAPPPTGEPFDFRATMRRWDEGADRAFRLMSAFFERKGIVCATKAELDVTRGRHIRAAREVVAFDTDRILRAMDACEADKRRGGVEWTLETVKKKLTNGFK